MSYFDFKPSLLSLNELMSPKWVKCVCVYNRNESIQMPTGPS